MRRVIADMPCPCCRKQECQCFLSEICMECFRCKEHCECPEGFASEVGMVIDRLLAKKKALL